jgi:hypothetical protein
MLQLVEALTAQARDFRDFRHRDPGRASSRHVRSDSRELVLDGLLRSGVSPGRLGQGATVQRLHESTPSLAPPLDVSM